MRRTLLAVFILSWFAFLAPLIQAGEKVAETPAVVVRVKSLDALVQNLQLVVELVGQKEVAQQIEGLVKSKIGKKGLEGVDPSRPFGVYARFGKEFDDIKGAILIPIVDEKTFLTLLDNVGVAYQKDRDDIYTHKAQNVDLYFRFAHKYLFVTGVKTDSIQLKNLPDPAKALAVGGDATLSVLARVEHIPDAAKLIALEKLKEAIEAGKSQKQPNESAVQKAFRLALLDDFYKLAAGVIREAAEVRFDLDVADNNKDLSVRFNVAPKPGSELAKTIKNIGDLKSPLAGLAKTDLAFQGSLHFALTDSLNNAFVKVIEETRDGAIKGIQDETKKAQARTLFDALMPTAKAGEFQAVAAVIGPKQDHYTLLGALKLKEGNKLGKAVHDLLKDALMNIPAEQRDKIKLDFDSVGAIKIHKFEVPKDANLDKLIENVAGDNQLYLAFREDALFLALGKDSLAVLKAALTKSDSAASQPLLFDFDVARMAKLMAQTKEQKDLAAELFPPGKSGNVRLSIDGGTNLNVQLRMQLNVLRFLSKLKNE